MTTPVLPDNETLFAILHKQTYSTILYSIVSVSGWVLSVHFNVNIFCNQCSSACITSTEKHL